MFQSNNTKVIFITGLCLFFSIILSSCSINKNAQIYNQNPRIYNNFIIVKPEKKDSLKSIAKKYYNDSSRAWMIAEFNNIENLTTDKEIVIPLRPFRLGGLYPMGYQTVPVLAYQRFGPAGNNKSIISQTAFEAQMRFLKENGYKVITLDQLICFFDFKIQIPEKSVVITIDEGWNSVIDIAYPILKKYEFPATVFIYTGFIGGKKALSWEQIRFLEKEGFDIQCKTLTHRNLTKEKKDESFCKYFNALERELVDSKKLIEKKLNKECRYIAYPYGKTNHLVVAMLKKHGYRAGFTANRGKNPFFVDIYNINRSVIYGDYDLENFKKNLYIFQKR